VARVQIRRLVVPGISAKLVALAAKLTFAAMLPRSAGCNARRDHVLAVPAGSSRNAVVLARSSYAVALGELSLTGTAPHC
jgi:hypothetical protein